MNAVAFADVSSDYGCHEVEGIVVRGIDVNRFANLAVRVVLGTIH